MELQGGGYEVDPVDVHRPTTELMLYAIAADEIDMVRFYGVHFVVDHQAGAALYGKIHLETMVPAIGILFPGRAAVEKTAGQELQVVVSDHALTPQC